MRDKIFISVIIGMVIFFGGFIAIQEYILQAGDQVILATRPVDPRDLFRGEYVILRYAIEDVEIVTRATAGKPEGTPVYLRLEAKDNRVHRVTAVRFDAPQDDYVWLQGEVSGSSGIVRFPDLEQFYVPEGSGLDIEAFGTRLHVRVSIKDGEPRVVELLDDELDPIDPSVYLDN